MSKCQALVALSIGSILATAINAAAQQMEGPSVSTSPGNSLSASCDARIVANDPYWLSLSLTILDPSNRRIVSGYRDGQFTVDLEIYVTLGSQSQSGRYLCIGEGRATGLEPEQNFYGEATLMYDNWPCGNCWATPAFTRTHEIKYRFDSSFPETKKAMFEAAADAWKAVHPSMREVGPAETADVIVYMADTGADLGRTAAGPSGGTITIDDALENLWNDTFAQATMAHEIGHMLGLRDVSGSGCDDRLTVMYYASVWNDSGLAKDATCSDKNALGAWTYNTY